MYIGGSGSTVEIIGCRLSGNSADTRADDIYVTSGATVNIGGCPAGSSGAAGAALDTHIPSSATSTGERKSYSCVACVSGKYQDQAGQASCKSCLLYTSPSPRD